MAQRVGIMKRSGTLLVAVFFVGGVTLGLLFARQWKTRTTPPPAVWPRVVSYELEVDLTKPGHFRGSARVAFDRIPAGPLHFLLNRSLTIHRAEIQGDEVAGGRAVDVSHLHRLPTRYHSEGRVIRVALDSPPPNDAVQLVLEFTGTAERGTEGSDWRGILFVGETEARMSEQTVFYPQIPLDLAGPAIELAPFRLTVLAPTHWEVFAPLPALGVEAKADGKRWRFEGTRPQVLSVLAGDRQRQVAQAAETRVVTLLRDEHADLAGDFNKESGAAMEHFAARFGEIDAGSLGVFEMSCRSASSYNWISEGVMAIDRQALGREIPVKTLAHEVAHLWWGQAVSATGPGERFLTEGLAEFSAWTYLEDTGRGELVRGAISTARRKIAELVELGESSALDSVGFDHTHYTDLAYGKGALVLRALRGQLAPGACDAALARLIVESDGRPVTLDDFQRELRRATGQDQLRVPWLDGSGDLDLELASVEEAAGSCSLTVRATPATAQCRIDPAGTPVAIQLGGADWSERHTLLLDDAETHVKLDTGSRTVTYARLDPEGVWPRHPRSGTIVLDGAKLVASEPTANSRVRFGGQSIRLTFDRALAVPDLELLRAAQADAGGSEILGLAVLDVDVVNEGCTLVLRTEPWVPDRRYRVLLTPLVDRSDTPLAHTTFEFATLVSDDETPPRIIASVPTPGATVSPGEIEVSVTFDEAMQRGQGFPGSVVRANQRRGLKLPDFADFGTWDESFRTITWTVTEPQPDTTYCLPFVGGTFRDLSGNGAADFELTFTVTKEETASPQAPR